VLWPDEAVEGREGLLLGFRRFPLAFSPPRLRSGSIDNEGIGDEFDIFSRILRSWLLLNVSNDEFGFEGVSARHLPGF